MHNSDLIWDLEKFRKQQRAKDLIMGVENRLCVFSSSVEQLYTNYDIFFPKEQDRKIVILPNPYAPHDTFHGIDESVVSATGLFLVSDQKTKALQLILPINRAEKKYKQVPFSVGMALINTKRERPFLPVVMKGDLREFNQDTPCLHLRSLNLSKLNKRLSALETSAIEDVIQERLLRLS